MASFDKLFIFGIGEEPEKLKERSRRTRIDRKQETESWEIADGN